MEREVLDDEEVVLRPSGMAGQPVVLQPHTGVGFPLYFGTVVKAWK